MLLQRSLIVVMVITIAALTGCGGGGHSGSESGNATPLTVSVARVDRSDSQSFQRFVGTVEARSEALIQTKIQARVEKIVVKLGSTVKTGDLLAQMDTRDINARVQQARAVHDQASSDFERYKTLIDQQATSQQSYDDAKARAIIAQSNMQEAEAMLDYARVTAPFSGTVTRKMVEVGDMTAPGQPLFELEEIGARRFVVSLPETNMDQVKLGDSVTIEIPTLDQVIKGVVAEYSPSANPTSRSYEVKIDLANLSMLKPGQFGRLLLGAGDEGGLFVPCSAIVKRGQLELVYIASSDGSASLRYVRSGRKLGDICEILSGLTEDESVILTSPASLTDGQKVVIAQ